MTRLVDNTMDLIYMYLHYYSFLNGGQAVALFGVLHHWSIWVANAIVVVVVVVVVDFYNFSLRQNMK